MFLQCHGEGRETGNRNEDFKHFEAQASNCYIVPSTAMY